MDSHNRNRHLGVDLASGATDCPFVASTEIPVSRTAVWWCSTPSPRRSPHSVLVLWTTSWTSIWTWTVDLEGVADKWTSEWHLNASHATTSILRLSVWNSAQVSSWIMNRVSIDGKLKRNYPWTCDWIRFFFLRKFGASSSNRIVSQY